MFPYPDLRSFMEALEKEGELVRVRTEVDSNLELAAIMRKVLDKGGPAIFFEKIKGFPEEYGFFSGTLSTYSKYALALGLSKDASVNDIVSCYKERIKRPIKPRLGDAREAPCKENILLGEEVDLFKLPAPFWHPRDGGRYIGTFHCMAAKDPDSDWVNVGIYRMVIHDKNHLGILIQPTQHASLIYEKYERQSRGMPVAISIGQDPLNVIAAFGSFEAGICEWEMAGALRQRPVEMVPAETVELAVPAGAEIVIEGEVLPFERREEGPFGEFSGYYGGTKAARPVIRVNCITHRHRPILTGLLEGKPVQENNIMSSVEHMALLDQILNDQLGLGVKAIWADPWAANHAVIVALKPRYPGHTNRVAHAIWASKLGQVADYVIAVDEDIAPGDLNQVLWAICTRCKPDRDILIFRRERATGLWPCLDGKEREVALGCKVLFDATFPAEWPTEWVPKVSDWFDYPEEIREKVEKKWLALWGRSLAENGGRGTN